MNVSTINQHVNFITCYLSLIILVDEGCIAGFLILKPIHKADFDNAFSRAFPIEGAPLKKCTSFRNFLSRKADVFGDLNCEVYLEFSLLCIVPEYRKKGKQQYRKVILYRTNLRMQVQGRYS